MLNMSKSKLLQGTAAAAVLIGSIIPARADITIAVAANFRDPVAALLTEWYNLDGFTGTAYPGPTGDLENQIISNTGTHYDLFFAANTDAPYDLYYNHSDRILGAPFNYAEGGLVYFSRVFDVSSGLTYPLANNLLIANPCTAPYGLAALTLLTDSPWSLVLSSCTTVWPQASYVYSGGNIGQTFDKIVAHSTTTHSAGFVAKADVCIASATAPYTASWKTSANYTGSGTPYYYEYYAEGGGSSNADYPANGATAWTTDARGTHKFTRILQAAIEVENSAVNTTRTEVKSFIDFVSGRTHPGVALDIIKSYCYRWAIGE